MMEAMATRSLHEIYQLMHVMAALHSHPAIDLSAIGEINVRLLIMTIQWQKHVPGFQRIEAEADRRLLLLQAMPVLFLLNLLQWTVTFHPTSGQNVDVDAAGGGDRKNHLVVSIEHFRRKRHQRLQEIVEQLELVNKDHDGHEEEEEDGEVKATMTTTTTTSLALRQQLQALQHEEMMLNENVDRLLELYGKFVSLLPATNEMIGLKTWALFKCALCSSGEHCPWF